MSRKRRRERNSSHNHTRDRGQLVLLAAIALAVALIPLVLVYVQLGYHDDIHATGTATPEKQVERTLQHGLHNATTDIARTYEWANHAGDDRTDAIARVRDRLDPTLQSINRSGLDGGTVLVVTYNQTHATSWEQGNCPSGPDRQFGSCETSEGVVVQDRGGQTHVLGAAFDVRVSTPETDTQFTTLIEP